MSAAGADVELSLRACRDTERVAQVSPREAGELTRREVVIGFPTFGHQRGLMVESHRHEEQERLTKVTELPLRQGSGGTGRLEAPERVRT